MHWKLGMNLECNQFYPKWSEMTRIQLQVAGVETSIKIRAHPGGICHPCDSSIKTQRWEGVEHATLSAGRWPKDSLLPCIQPKCFSRWTRRNSGSRSGRGVLRDHPRICWISNIFFPRVAFFKYQDFGGLCNDVFWIWSNAFPRVRFLNFHVL